MTRHRRRWRGSRRRTRATRRACLSVRARTSRRWPAARSRFSASAARSGARFPTEVRADGISAFVDDETLRRGRYRLRATVTNAAGLQQGTDRGTDGELKTLELPIRTASRLQAGRRVGTVCRRHGRAAPMLLEARPRRRGAARTAHHVARPADRRAAAGQASAARALAARERRRRAVAADRQRADQRARACALQDPPRGRAPAALSLPRHASDPRRRRHGRAARAGQVDAARQPAQT